MTSTAAPVLRRRLGLTLLTLYGVGITVGAGIYVLIGAVAGRAGSYSVWSFLIAAVVMAFTVASYAELSTRFPVSAGEAAYVREAFRSRALSTATGLLTIAIGVVSSATVAIGAAGYIGQFLDWPNAAIIVTVVIVLGAVAGWGILESVLLAALFTVIEVSGLALIIGAGFVAGVPALDAVMVVPPLDMAAWSGISLAALLAFFAFIGFEDLANVVEEAKSPHRDLPRAMALTLVISTVLYVAVAAIAVVAVPPAELAGSPAPLSLVFHRLLGISPAAVGLIAIVATLNTILAMMTMAARVIYGMARQGDLPAIAGHVHHRTATPLLATLLIVVLTLVLALVFPIERLAEWTSVATLTVFALVNIALLRLRHRRVITHGPHVRVPIWVPAVGFATCVAMIAVALF
ncbi:MAG: APC family permease [Pseudolabrys sp.]